MPPGTCTTVEPLITTFCATPPKAILPSRSRLQRPSVIVGVQADLAAVELILRAEAVLNADRRADLRAAVRIDDGRVGADVQTFTQVKEAIAGDEVEPPAIVEHNARRTLISLPNTWLLELTLTVPTSTLG